jgi:CBS domain-containing protein
MSDKLRSDVSSRLILDTTTASDLMTPSPVSLREDATVHEAVALLTDRGISAASVIDEAGALRSPSTDALRSLMRRTETYRERRQGKRKADVV